jgi:hypothetical protein
MTLPITASGRDSEELVSDRQQPEVPLLGGTANRGQVVRVGNTVRRPQRRTSPATHALLCHLTDIGFDGAPRFIGIDSQKREVLSYIPGTAVTPPYPDWALTDEALVSVAELLRAYHQAVRTFNPTPYAWPSSPPESFKGELISHNDPNLDNVVFRAGKAVALIDFDLASPGCSLWDIACAARLWAPLRPDSYINDVRRGRVLDRFRLFVDSYGLVDADRLRVVDAVAQNHNWCYDIVRDSAARGHLAFCEYWTAGATERADRTYHWYLENGQALRAALV